MRHTDELDRAEHEHTHDHPRWMIGFMAICLVIGAVGIFYRSFYLDLAFVLTMGFCVGHHLWHRFRHR